jgi:hypothetical protein
MNPVIALRTNVAKIERKPASGATSNTGEPVPAEAETIYAALPCYIESNPRWVEMELSGTGGPLNYDRRVSFIADGIITPNATPGSTVIDENGNTQIVTGNGRAAFPDIEVGDRVTDENGNEYLVAAVQFYYDVFPNIQAQLDRGKAWG